MDSRQKIVNCIVDNVLYRYIVHCTIALYCTKYTQTFKPHIPLEEVHVSDILSISFTCKHHEQNRKMKQII